MGIEVAVAITRLAKHEDSISRFVRFVNHYFRLLFAALVWRCGMIHLVAQRTGVAWDYNVMSKGKWPAVAGYTQYVLKECSLAKIGILIIEDDEANQSALRQLLDSEGWQVRAVPVVGQALGELSSGEWSLVIANIAMMGLSSPVYLTLRELALAPAVEDGNVRARVLFVVPESAAGEALPVFEREKLPYVLKPFQFHDLLEKVSDLLMEAAALSDPIRRVRHDSSLSERKLKEGRVGRESGNALSQRNTSMFAKREAYVMTEEEIADYEKSENDERDRKNKKKPLLNRY